MDADGNLKCRLCRKKRNHYIDIFDPNGTNNLLVWKVIKEITELDVSKDDGLPPSICTDCMDKVTQFKCFKTMCIASRIEFLKDVVNDGLVDPQRDSCLALDFPLMNGSLLSSFLRDVARENSGDAKTTDSTVEEKARQTDEDEVRSGSRSSSPPDDVVSVSSVEHSGSNDDISSAGRSNRRSSAQSSKGSSTGRVARSSHGDRVTSDDKSQGDGERSRRRQVSPGSARTSVRFLGKRVWNGAVSGKAARAMKAEPRRRMVSNPFHSVRKGGKLRLLPLKSKARFANRRYSSSSESSENEMETSGKDLPLSFRSSSKIMIKKEMNPSPRQAIRGLNLKQCSVVLCDVFRNVDSPHVAQELSKLKNLRRTVVKVEPCEVDGGNTKNCRDEDHWGMSGKLRKRIKIEKLSAEDQMRKDGRSTRYSSMFNQSRDSEPKVEYCLLCHIGFRSKFLAVQHRLSEHAGKGRGHACLICKRIFPNPGALREHQGRHKKGLPFMCKLCSCGFSSNKGLSAHVSQVHRP